MVDVLSPTFLFADLAGFTALTEAHGDLEAADLADAFHEAASALARDGGAQFVKGIGDAVMMRTERAADAVPLGLRLAHEAMPAHERPEVRVGMHTGEAVRRGEDWFGATVNVAARITAAAKSGEVLVSDAVRRAAGDLDGIRFVSRGARRLRNVAKPVVLFAAEPVGASPGGWPIDPVCRMAVQPGREAAREEFDGVDYLFCSASCAQAFRASPRDYADAGRG